MDPVILPDPDLSLNNRVSVTIRMRIRPAHNRDGAVTFHQIP
jgi:hypothetical protein